MKSYPAASLRCTGRVQAETAPWPSVHPGEVGLNGSLYCQQVCCEVLLRLRRRVEASLRHTAVPGKGSTGPAELPASNLRSATSISNRPKSFARALVDFKPESSSKNDELLKTKSKKKRKKRRFVFSRNILEGRSNEADESVDQVVGASRTTTNKAACSSSSDDGRKKENDKIKKKKKRKKWNKDQPSNRQEETTFVEVVRKEEHGSSNFFGSFPVADNNNQTGSSNLPICDVTLVNIRKPKVTNSTKTIETPSDCAKNEDHQVSPSVNDVTTADSCLSASSQPELIYRQVDCVITTVTDDDNEYNRNDSCFFLIDDESMVTSHPALQLHCCVEKGPELLRRSEVPEKLELNHRNDDYIEEPLKSASFANNSHLPPKQLRHGRSQRHSPTLAPRTYSKNTDAGYLADVHGSLPVLTVDNRKNSATVGRSAGLGGVEGKVNGDVLVSKSATSLQGKQRFATGESVVVERSPLDGVTGRRTPSRLDIEHINRSQIFKMISDLTVKPIKSVLPKVDPLVIGRRREIEDVVELMDTSGRVVTITGGYGSGKSTLAVCVARVLCDLPSMTSFVAVHVDLIGCRTVESVFRRTVNVLGVHFRFDERRFLYNWINAREQRILMIYDNLDDLLTHGATAQLSNLIDEMLIRIRNVRLLCTGGRKQFYRGVSAESEVYRIGDVRASDACEVLRRMLPEMPCDRVDQVAAACGYVPTPLRVVANALSLTGNAFFDTGNLLESLTSFKQSTTGQVSELVERLSDGDEYQQRRLLPVVECLTKIISALGETAGKLLRGAALFASGFDLLSVAAVVPEFTDRNLIESAFNFMADVGLVLPVTTNADSEDLETDRCRRYQLPVLVRSVAMAMSLTSEVGRWSALYRSEVLRRLSSAVERYHEGADGFLRAQSIIDDEFDNIVDVLWKTVEREDAFIELSYLTNTESSAFLAEFLPDDLYVAVYEAIEREATAPPSTDDAGIRPDRTITRSQALACLSYRHSLAGRSTDAVLCAEKAIEIVRFPTSSSGESFTSGGEESDTSRHGQTSTLAMCLYCLSRAQWVAGDRRKSLATAKQSFDAWKGDRTVTSSTTSRASTEVLPSLPSVGAVYASDWYASMLVQSENFQAARHCYNVSDAVVRDRLSGHPMTIDGFDSRRAVWDRLSLFERAAGAARAAADTARLHLGEHPRTAVLLARLGDSIVKRGSLNDAISAVVDALQMRLSVHGSRHRDAVVSYRTLANLMLRTGQYDQAERFGRAAIDAANVIWTRRKTPSDQEDDDGDDGYEDGGSSSMRGGCATDDDAVPLEKIVAEARNIVGQAQYRSECRSMVFLQLETRT